MAAVTAVVVTVFTLFYRTILSISFDNTFARSQHLPVSVMEYLLMALIAMTIVSTLRLVGIVLAMSLLTVPQMTANLFTFSFRRIIAASIAIGWADCLAGLAISYWLNVPSGAAIIFASIVIYAALRTIKSAVREFK